jgi:hypothetical protein
MVRVGTTRIQAWDAAVHLPRSTVRHGLRLVGARRQAAARVLPLLHGLVMGVVMVMVVVTLCLGGSCPAPTRSVHAQTGNAL